MFHLPPSGFNHDAYVAPNRTWIAKRLYSGAKLKFNAEALAALILSKREERNCHQTAALLGDLAEAASDLQALTNRSHRDVC
jgi:hypothetical protein